MSPQDRAEGGTVKDIKSPTQGMTLTNFFGQNFQTAPKNGEKVSFKKI
jgi:hypothetical protein